MKSTFLLQTEDAMNLFAGAITKMLIKHGSKVKGKCCLKAC